MMNPPGSQPNSSSYIDLLKRITRGVQTQKLDEQILEIAQKAYEKELEKEKIVLSRPEKKRLFEQVLKTVLTDIQDKLFRA